MEDSDQWKLNGDCSKCRRANYCNKNCSARNKRINGIIQQALDEVVSQEYPGLKQVIENLK